MELYACLTTKVCEVVITASDGFECLKIQMNDFCRKETYSKTFQHGDGNTHKFELATCYSIF